MSQGKSTTGSDSQQSQSVCAAANAILAEHIKLILALYEIRAAVIDRDPLHLATAIAEVIVATSDADKALHVLEDSLQADRASDWNCANCGEHVPNTFDLCWNCGALHHSLVSEQHDENELPNWTAAT